LRPTPSSSSSRTRSFSCTSLAREKRTFCSSSAEVHATPFLHVEDTNGTMSSVGSIMHFKQKNPTRGKIATLFSHENKWKDTTGNASVPYSWSPATEYFTRPFRDFKIQNSRPLHGRSLARSPDSNASPAHAAGSSVRQRLADLPASLDLARPSPYQRSRPSVSF
jgi:hypothetical protein